MPVDVHIVLSAYNGRAHLPAQIQAIREQRDVSWSLHIRDDGSSDPGSRALLADYAQVPGIRVTYGDNVGTVASFWELMRSADRSARCIAFCDQDDWWYPDKLARAVSALDGCARGVPAAYGSQVDIGDENLNVVGRSPRWPHAPGFGNALVENIISGCTLVVNQAALERMLQVTAEDLADVQMHDAWCYLVCTAFGDVVFEPGPSMIYRQHAHNVVGARARPVQRFAAKLINQARGGSGTRLRRQAARFRRVYGAQLGARERAVLTRFIDQPGRLGRVRTALDRRIWRQFRIDDLALRVLLLAGRV